LTIMAPAMPTANTEACVRIKLEDFITEALRDGGPRCCSDHRFFKERRG
jgi:hypothetical protein